MDQMVLKTQQWLNKTYGKDKRYQRISEDGQTGWRTIHALTRALQIELGIQDTADNFGPNTEARFQAKYKPGIKEQSPDDKTEANVYALIQGALWCKGYSTGSNQITRHFYSGTGAAVKALKKDMGFTGDSMVTISIAKALFSMKQYVLLKNYGGKSYIRQIQQYVNRKYYRYTGFIPTDGLYGREMSEAMVKVLQAIEGFSVSEATGYFGKGTKARLQGIAASNYKRYPDWVWLANAMLICNGKRQLLDNNWEKISAATKSFQKDMALAQTGNVNAQTWMALFISTGDPDRRAKACDTRFEITDELARHLKADGYEIVGRYLTEPNQKHTAVKDYFKAIRPGELERIVKHGLKFFPIYQDYGTKLSHFHVAYASKHALEASLAATRLRIPSTVIYFAVDFDATDEEISSTIIPYFRRLKELMGSKYQVGVYGTRNVCARVVDAGYAVSSFVGDLSSGYSGNLGYTMPKSWNYDQFAELSGYKGKWDLDKVAYAGKVPAVSTLEDLPKIELPPYETEFSYELPPSPNTQGLPSMESVIPLIEELEALHPAFLEHIGNNPIIANNYMLYEAGELCLNYLAQIYSKQEKFSFAGIPFDKVWADFVNKRNPELAKKLERFIGENRIEVRDAIGGKNDLAHFAYTCACYASQTFAPDFWTGWGGDLATGMADLHVYLQKYPKLDVQATANALIGSDVSSPAPYFTSNAVDVKSLGSRCNYTDLCDDADAITIAKKLVPVIKKDMHALSRTMRAYYGSLTQRMRYTAYKEDGLDYSSIEALSQSIWAKTNELLEPLPKPMISLEHLPLVGLMRLAKDSNHTERQAACRALAHYLLKKSR